VNYVYNQSNYVDLHQITKFGVFDGKKYVLLFFYTFVILWDFLSINLPWHFMHQTYNELINSALKLI
jgi:hypothetical protein